MKKRKREREKERKRERKEGRKEGRKEKAKKDPASLCDPFGSHARCEFRQNYKPRIGEGLGHSLREGFAELKVFNVRAVNIYIVNCHVTSKYNQSERTCPKFRRLS